MAQEKCDKTAAPTRNLASSCRYRTRGARRRGSSACSFSSVHSGDCSAPYRKAMIMGGSNGDSSSGACSALVKTDASFCAILCKRSEGGREGPGIACAPAVVQWACAPARSQAVRPARAPSTAAAHRLPDHERDWVDTGRYASWRFGGRRSGGPQQRIPDVRPFTPSQLSPQSIIAVSRSLTTPLIADVVDYLSSKKRTNHGCRHTRRGARRAKADDAVGTDPSRRRRARTGVLELSRGFGPPLLHSKEHQWVCAAAC